MSLLFEHIARWGRETPNAPAISEEGTTWTYGELLEKSNRLAHTLWHKHAIRPGDRVALIFWNQKELLVSFYALRRIGAVPVPVNLMLPPEDIGYVVKHSGSKLIMTTVDIAQKMAAKPNPKRSPVLVANLPFGADLLVPSWEKAVAKGDPKFEPEDIHFDPKALAVLMYTSGTTGKPKGVMLSEENLTSNLVGVEPVLDFRPSDKVLIALPLFHAFGLIIGLYALSLGAPVVLVPKFTPKRILQAIAEDQVSVLPLVPTMFTVLLEGARRVGAEHFKSLRLCVSGGASLAPDLLKRIEQTLEVVVLEGYGLTETSPVLTVNHPVRGSIPRSVGKPLPNVTLKLVDTQGNDLPWKAGTASDEGEIWANGPNIMLGYYQQPDETRAVLNAEGWFRTGDLGHFDAEGNLFISGGRIKDLIIKSGENISPIRIEQVLYDHPDVLEASVIGLPDTRLGERILACIQLRPEATLTEKEASQTLKAFCLEQLAPHMVPDAFRFYTELPKNPAGKILKPKLREENVASGDGAAARPTVETTTAAGVTPS